MRERKGPQWLRNRDIPSGHQRCSTCQEVLAFSHFCKAKSSYTGYNYRCKPCQKISTVVRRVTRKKTNQPVVHLLGLTQDEYNRKFEAQGGVCAICGQPETGTAGVYKTPRRISIDHNHDTGQIRDLLCYQCNSGLGYFKDNPELLEKAANYLKRWG